MNHSLQRKIDLLYLLTHKEITLKYKRTTLGIFWSLLNPILLATVFFVAFSVFMRFKVKNYPFFLLSTLFPWNWFLSSIIISGRSLVDNVSLIKKVIFPRHYLVIAVVLAQLVHLLFSFPVLLILSLLSSNGPSLEWLIGIPLLILIQFAFTFGIALMISIMNTFFRDIEYLVSVLMNLMFWVTPVTYPMEAIPKKFHFLIQLNPLTGLMTAWRGLFLENTILWNSIALSSCMAMLAICYGIHLFRRLEKKLDEVL